MVKSKLIILLLLVVVLPTALLSWGGFQVARQQNSQFESRVKQLMQEQLSELDSRISKYFENQEAFLQSTTSKSIVSVDAAREMADASGVIDHVFIITSNNILAYPNPLIAPLNQGELDFYNKIKTVVDDGEIQNQILQGSSYSTNTGNTLPSNQARGQVNDQDSSVPYSQPNQAQSAQSASAPFQSTTNQSDNSPQLNVEPQQSSSPTESSNRSDAQDSSGIEQSENSPPQQVRAERGRQELDQSAQSLQQAKPQRFEVCDGWFIWYWGRGVNLIFWQRLSTGTTIGVALERSRWMADLIAELPDTVGESLKEDRQVRQTKIVNSSGETVYQWGQGTSEGKGATEGMVMAAEIPVSQPLSSWKLQMWVTPEELQSQSLVGLNILLGVVAFSLALIAVAWIFFHEYNKEMKEASKRVSFVNQVSHELRTPLTNIRMYAELLNQQVQQLEGVDAETAKKRIEVVETESHRLSRLISNVLSFAGSQKKKLEMRPSEGKIDDCVHHTLSSFTPHLERLGLEIQTDLQATTPVRFDSDVLGQIIGNLISNVEKYAADGSFIEITTRLDNEVAVITIRDDGPGIDRKNAEQVFEPFWRLSNELQHASGTGIGLSISRELARMHGGDVELDFSRPGACFVVRIRMEKKDQ